MTGLTALTIPAQTLRAKRSARARPWTLTVDREIVPEDLLGLMTAGPSNPKAPLAAIRDGHHMLARLLAEGKSAIEVSAICGYSTARIRTLSEDPAFKEIVAHYSEQKIFAEADIQSQVKHIALTAGSVLKERLETEPESFSNEELRRLSEGALDRIGHGPSATLNHNINNPAQILAALKEAMVAEGRGQVLDRKTIEASYETVDVQVRTEAALDPLESGDDP